MLQRKTPRPCAESARAGPGARRSSPRGGRGGLGRLGRPPRRGVGGPPPPLPPPRSRGEGIPRREACPFKEAALPGCARLHGYPGAGGGRRREGGRLPPLPDRRRELREPGAERIPSGTLSAAETGAAAAAATASGRCGERRGSRAGSPGSVGGQDARGRAPCSGPRRRGRPLAHRLLAGPANPGWASASDGCARGRGARRGAAELGALPRC